MQDNAREHIFDGIVVTHQAGAAASSTRPRWPASRAQRVTLTIDADEAQNLPEHRGFRGTLETHAKRTGRRWKRWMGDERVTVSR